MTELQAAGSAAPSPSARRAAFVVPNLRIGGMQRVCLLLAGAFLRAGWRVDVVVLKRDGALLAQLPPACRVVDLAAPRLRRALPGLRRYLREDPPDFVLASIWPLTSIVAIAARLARFRGALALIEHSTLSLSPVGRGLDGLALRASMRWLNGRAGRLVAVSDGVRDDLIALGAPPEAVVTIHNPIAVEAAHADDASLPAVWRGRPRTHRFLAVGRLKAAKDYPTMLDAMAALLARGVDAGLAIAGDGVDRASLEQRLADDPRLAAHVVLLGDVASPGPLYAQAGLLLFSSRFEGFGNVLVEAMGAGVPVVSTDCRSGPREILRDGRLGELVPVGDAAAFADAVERTLAHPPDAAALRARAADFRPDAVATRYLELFEAARPTAGAKAEEATR